MNGHLIVRTEPIVWAGRQEKDTWSSACLLASDHSKHEARNSTLATPKATDRSEINSPPENQIEFSSY